MNSINNKTALFIGNEQVMLDCAEIFIHSGGKIAAICGRKKIIKLWAIKNNITFLTEDINLNKSLGNSTFNYIFSITNTIDIISEIKITPKIASIHLHEGILPGYAGANNSFWAALNGESEFGITWQLLDKNIEKDDIICSYSFPIKYNDTASSILRNCYSLARSTFAKILDQLDKNTLTHIKQDLSKRTFYSNYQKPLLAGAIDWNVPAERISKIVKNLNFDNLDNKIQTPKIKIENDFYIIKDLGLTSKESERKPGTIIKVSECELHISTTTNDIILRSAYDLFGNIVPLKELITKYGIVPGFELTYIESKFAQEFLEYDFSINKNESYWTNELTNIETLNIYKSSVRNKNLLYITLSIDIDNYIIQLLRTKLKIKPKELFRNLFILFLAEKSKNRYFSIGYYDSGLINKLNSIGILFSQIVPINFQFNSSNSQLDNLLYIQKAFELAQLKKTFYLDVFERYTDLRINKGNIKYPFTVSEIEDIQTFEELNESELNLIVTTNGHNFLSYNSSSVSQSEINFLLKEYYEFISKIYYESNKEINNQNIFDLAQKEIELNKINTLERSNHEINNSENNIQTEEKKKIVFMFPGAESQYLNMGLGLYLHEPVFRNELNNCFEIIKSKFNIDIKEILYPLENNLSKCEKLIQEPLISCFAVFIVEYSLAKFWISLGVTPNIVTGVKVGEYAAACISEVLTLKDGLNLLYSQKSYFNLTNNRENLLVNLSEKELYPYLSKDISIESIITANCCILSVDKKLIDSIEDSFQIKKISYSNYSYRTAIHKPINNTYSQENYSTLENVKIDENKIPLLSSTSGKILDYQQFQNRNYWINIFKKTNRFTESIRSFVNDDQYVFLEIGPGRTLNNMLSIQSVNKANAAYSMKKDYSGISDLSYINKAIVYLNSYRVEVNLTNYNSIEQFKTDKIAIENKGIRKPFKVNNLIVLNEIQSLILAIWKKFLNIEAISLTDDFMELGGNSLLLINCITELNKYYKINVPVQEILANPTIKNIEFVINKAKDNIFECSSFIRPVPREVYNSKIFIMAEN